MKKSLLVLGVAVAALASCTNEEVVSVPEGRAIGFNSFVNNNTKAVTEVNGTNLTSFYVFGNYGEGTWTPVYTNVEVKGNAVGDDSEWTPTQVAYWQASEKYRFAAYSNGNSSTTATFDAASQKMTFAGYNAVDNQKDLIVAIPAELTSNADVTQNEDVNLSFYHMLSQVKFTFNTTDSKDYTMKISDVKVESATVQADGTYTYNASANLINWETNPTTGTYEFGTLNDIAADIASDGSTNSLALLVIPQGDTKDLNVTFTATFWDAAHSEESPIAKGNFTAPLTYEGQSLAEGTTANTWTPGFKYNYSVTINGSTIDPDLEEKVIKFNVDVVDGWDTATDITTTPSKQS